MNKASFLIVMFLITFFNAFGQKPQNSQIFISGIIIDSETKEPLEYATIVLNDTKNNQLSGGITDSKGSFNIKMNPGIYDISFEFISFKTIKLSKKIVNQSINFGTIE